MVDELTREPLASERLEEWRAEELVKLRADIAALEMEVNRREWRDMLRSLDTPYQAPTVDAALPIMRSRLAQRRAKLVEVLDATVIPPGMEDDGLDTAAPEDRAARAVKDVLKRLVRKRALPVEDPLISDEEVEEEHERQTGERPGSGSGSGQARRRKVRSR